MQRQVWTESAVREPAAGALPAHGPGAPAHTQGGHRVRIKICFHEGHAARLHMVQGCRLGLFLDPAMHKVGIGYEPDLKCRGSETNFELT